MSELTVDGVCKRYDGQPVLEGATLAVPAGAVLALLGRSGCGKTTLLRLVAGFERADAGRIALGGRVLDGGGHHLPPEKRGIGYVPQEGTLFPHLTVAGNVGFGLRGGARARARIAEALALTGLSGLERRYPHELSGGQQQRTALARALAPSPPLVLLDEPFAALDLGLRRSVCADVVALLRQTGASAILVTHDPVEAFASADLVAVMQDGVIAQCADPASVYRAPVSAAVARLTGPTLFLPATVRDGAADTVLGPIRLSAPVPDGSMQLMLRPEQIVTTEAGRGVPALVTRSAFRGDHSVVAVAIGGTALEMRQGGMTDHRPGDTLHLAVRGSAAAFGAEP